MTGDIELDHGHSFSYQVTVFFPSYFQKQVIKSQFSVYDLHPAEEDANEVQKNTLKNMTRIDTNIFRDISSAKTAIPNDASMSSEYRHTPDVKVMRVKSAAYWLSSVTLTAGEPDWHKKQQALLRSENPPDKLLESGMNYLDVNDLATVNRINEDNALLHQQNSKRVLKRNPHFQERAKVITTNDGEKKIQIDYMPLQNKVDAMANTQQHLLRAVQDIDELSGEPEPPLHIPRTTLRFLPSHLLTSYYTLRFINSRDCKTKLLYSLNYYRAIQKRLALDLREFATRERMETHLTNPMTHSHEANQTVLASTHNSLSMKHK